MLDVYMTGSNDGGRVATERAEARGSIYKRAWFRDIVTSVWQPFVNTPWSRG